MITVAAALEHISSHARDYGVELVDLLLSRGRILAEPVVADRQFPPFDRVMMDGIAISSAAFDNGLRDFLVEQILAAGHVPAALKDAGSCIEVMTGACLPPGTDLVVPYEECSILDGVATVNLESVRPFQHIHRMGADSRFGDVLLAAGKRITPAMIAVLATVGKDQVCVRRLPRIAVCSTGDELVPVTAAPEPHQIRISNSFMLAAALAEEGIHAQLFHLPDDREKMSAQLADLLSRYDALLFSGAVSKGKYDFLPPVLEDLGMRVVFHRVAQKPGKPMLFGTFENGPLVFGLPGNPASTLVCYQIFFKTWLHASLQCSGEPHVAQLSEQIEFSPSLSYHLLVKLQTENGILLATPCAGGNSGDIPALQRADAILSLPPDRSVFFSGESFSIALLNPIS